MVQGKYGSVSYKSKKNKPKEQWKVVPGTHEPIIEIDLWNSVQSKIIDYIEIGHKAPITKQKSIEIHWKI